MFMKDKRFKWTNKMLQKEALKYKTRGEFSKGSPGAYGSSRNRNILDEICSHMPIRIDRSEDKNPAFKWTAEKIHKEALKYKGRREFYARSGGAYNAAIRTKILDQVCSHMSKNLSAGRKADIWSFDKIQKEALKYKSRSRFQLNAIGAYTRARITGVLDRVCSHMSFSRHYRSNEQLSEIAKLYSARGDFQKEEYGAYQAALKRDILDKICSHMKKSASTSCMEKELFDTIKSLYPKTQKLRDMKVRIKGKSHVQGFEIDIYIPELRKGVEFDGTYWHSDAGLKRSRSHWPQEDIDNYDKLKNFWFSSKGIKILHIKERDWLKNKEKCIKKCLDFFGK
jgi:very-short-patch-repair endonuclease